MRDTSVAALVEETDSGALSDARHRVMGLLLANGPMTGREVNAAVGHPSGHKRLSELERMGLVYERQVRACTVTGRQSIEWAASNGPWTPLPSRQSGKRPSKDALRILMGFIETANAHDPAEVAALDEVYGWVTRMLGGK